MKRLFVVLSALIFGVVPACDSDSSSGTNGSGTSGTGLVSGLDESLALSELTDEQQISACESSGEYFENWEAENAELIAQASCVMSVSMMMDFSEDADCQETYDQCIAGEGPFADTDDEPVDEEPDSCADQVEDLSECTEVTIADIEACQQAQLAMFTELYESSASVTCDDLDPADPESMPSKQYKDMSEIPECAELPEKCPPMAPPSESSEPNGPGDDLPGEPCTDDADCELEPYCDGDTSVEPLNLGCSSITGTCTDQPFGPPVTATHCSDGCADGVCVGGNVPEPEDEETPPQDPEPSDS